MNNPSTLIFLGLAVVWAIVLIPEGLKKISNVRRSDSIRSFNHQLSVLDRSGSAVRTPAPEHSVRTISAPASASNVIDLRAAGNARRSPTVSSPGAGRPIAAPGRVDRSAVPPSIKRRRQEVIAILGAVAMLTLICAVAFSPMFLVAHLIADALLVGYMSLIAQANRSTAISQTVRRPLGGIDSVRRESYAIRAVAAGR